MKQALTVKKNLEHRAKVDLKEIAFNKGFYGIKSMDLDELEDFLKQNFKGFSLERDYNQMVIIANWLEGEKEVSKKFYVDTTDEEILRDDY